MQRFLFISLFTLLINCFIPIIALAENRTIDLKVDYKTINFSGKKTVALAVNDQIPGPTLHLKQGEHVTINVHNHLDKGTTIHWHGVLVPWQMDGVLGVSQTAIEPGCSYHYEFTVEQSGTYWYHAHASTQEQDGIYGAIIIDPIQQPKYKYTKDYVIVLSDWSNVKGEQVFANLKKDGDYYSQRFPLQPSLVKFAHDYRNADTEERKNIIKDYKMMQKMRMSLYDLSDVAYDDYLLNGQSKDCPWKAAVKIGDTVRLRFIGGASSTIYRVKIPGEIMEMVHVQGNDVDPYPVEDFSIAPGETYDVLVKIKTNRPHIIYAESIDTLGKAYGALVTNSDQYIPYQEVLPFPEPKPVTRTMMSHMSHMPNMLKSEMHHGGMSGHKGAMSGHNEMNKMSGKTDHSMPTEPTIIGDTITIPKSTKMITKGTKYQNLIAAVETNNPNKPVDGVIKMELFGYMDRFIWFINGLPEYKSHPIPIEPGKRYRIIFTNNSMMRHPMHIHGHWFIFRKGNGSYDPLLHTIEVAPGETIVADIDSDASGQWFFHCHHIYHMMSGMARVFQYKTIIEVADGTRKPENIIEQQRFPNRPIVMVDEILPINCKLIHHPMGHHAGFYFANFLDLGEDPFHNVQKLTFIGLYGGDYNKLQLFINDASVKKGKVDEADLDIFYWRLISQFWAVKAGVNYFYRPGGPYWQPGIGIEGLMPFFIDTNIRAYYYRASLKLDAEFERDTQITNNFFIRTGVRSIFATKTIVKNEIGSGLNLMQYVIRPFYRIAPGINLFVEYEHEQRYSNLKRILKKLGKSTKEDILTFGIAVIF